MFRTFAVDIDLLGRGHPVTLGIGQGVLEALFDTPDCIGHPVLLSVPEQSKRDVVEGPPRLSGKRTGDDPPPRPRTGPIGFVRTVMERARAIPHKASVAIPDTGGWPIPRYEAASQKHRGSRMRDWARVVP